MDLKVPSLTFPETVERIFDSGSEKLKKWSSFMRIFMDVIVLVPFLVGCVYYIFVAGTIQEIISAKFNIDWDIRIMILVTVLPVSLIGQIRELKYLVPLSIVANILILATFLITFYYILRSPLAVSNQPMIASPESWPFAITTILFSICNIIPAFSMEAEMGNPRQYLGTFGVVNISSWIVAVFYAIVGFFSYLRYGLDIQNSVTSNLPMTETPALLAKLFIGLGVFLTFGIIFYLCMLTIWARIGQKIKGRSRKNFYQILIRFLMAVLMALMAALIPNLQVFISLIGTFCASTLSFFIPILIETIYKYPNGYGIWNWKLIVNAILFGFYVFVLMTGTYENVVEIVKIYSS
jgi:proton-coupled amino acid transporter